jgi:flagellar protein FlgJ
MRVGSLDILQNTIENTRDLEHLKKISGQDKLTHDKVIDKDKKVKEADSVAKEFETLFVDMMMKSMRETVKPEEESNAQNIYKSMLDSEYSKTMTDAQSFGIREMVKNWIIENS